MGTVARPTSLLVLVLTAWPAAAQPQGPAPPGPPLALVTTYADGRVTESVVPPSGFRAWTPFFPRVPGWRDREGMLPVTALNLAAKIEGHALRVTVSVLRGRVHEVVDAIGEVVVGVGQQVRVDALRHVGVLPITVSATWFAAPALHVPRGRSGVDQLEVEHIEPLLEPKPGYLVTVRNRSDAALVGVTYSTFVGAGVAASGQDGDPSARPVADAGGTFTFRVPIGSAVNAGGGFATGLPVDDVLVSGALWADGHHSGDAARVVPVFALHHGRLSTLRRVIPILRASVSAADPLAALDAVRVAVAALPIAAEAPAEATVMRLAPTTAPIAAGDVEAAISVGSQNVRARLLEDLDRVRPSLTPLQARQWLAEALPACEAWMSRLQALFPAR